MEWKVPKWYGRFKKILAMFLVAVTVASSFSVTSHATGEDASNDTDVISTSFYKLSSAAAGYFSDKLSRKEYDKLTASSSTAGGLLGYCDEADTSGMIVDWIQSALSTSSVTYSYSALSHVDVDSTSSEENGNPYVTYATYGRLLSGLGLDDTATGAESMTRRITGGIMWALYGLSSIVNTVFKGMITLLKMLNPFRLFYNEDGTPMVANMDELNAESADLAASDLADYVSDWYRYLNGTFAWAIVIPFATIGLIWALLMTRRDKKYELKKFLWRIAFVTIAVPMMGSIYTHALNWTDDMLDSGRIPSTKLIASLFVDFEGWAREHRLGVDTLPDTVSLSWSHALQQPSGNSVLNLRQTALAINAGVLDGLESIYEDASNSDDMSEWNSSVMDSEASDLTFEAISSVQDLLTRYMEGTFYYASDLEAEWKSSRAYSDVESMIQDTDTLNDWMNDKGHPYILGTNDADLWYHDGQLSRQGYNFGQGTNKGLSNMALYNYLSSKFTPAGVVVYSNEKAASGFVREAHYSVNMIGTGMMKALFYANAAILLACLVVMSICYGFGMLIANIKRTIQVLMSVPMAVMGSLRFGAKMMAHVMMLAIEILVTIFLYVVASELLMLVTGAFDALIGPLFKSNTVTIGLGGTAMNLVFSADALLQIELIVSSILYIWLTITLVKYRKQGVRAVDEMMADVINRLVPGARDSDMIRPDKPGIGNRLAGAAGAAAGAAVTGKVMQAQQNASNEEVSDEVSETPDGVAAGDGANVNVDNDDNSSTTSNVEESADGEGFDSSDSRESAAGRQVMEAESLDGTAGSGGTGVDHQAEQDGTGTGIDQGDNIEVQEAQPTELDADSDTNDSAGGAAAGGVGADSTDETHRGTKAGSKAGNAGASGTGAQQAAASMEAAAKELNQAQAQKQALEKAAGMSGAEAVAKAGGSTVNGEHHKKASEAGFQQAAAGKGTGTKDAKPAGMDAKAAAAASAAMAAYGGSGFDEKNGVAKAVSGQMSQAAGAVAAAETAKGASLTEAEASAAGSAAAAMLNKPEAVARDAAVAAADAVSGGQASAAEKQAVANGAAAMAKGPSEKQMVSDAAVAMAKQAAAADGKTLSASAESKIREKAGASVDAMKQNATMGATTQNAAMMGANAAVGGNPLSAEDKQIATQTAQAAVERSKRATSASGLAYSSAMEAGKAANGGKPLSGAQAEAVKSAANKASRQIQSAALTAAESAKGAPLTSAERQEVVDGCAVQCAQQASVNAMEAIQERPLSAESRQAAMSAAADHVASVRANNTQEAVAQRAAVQTANAVRKQHGQAALGRKAYGGLRQNVSNATSQAVAQSSVEAMAGRASLEAASSVMAGNGHTGMSEAQAQSFVSGGQGAVMQAQMNQSASAVAGRAGEYAGRQMSEKAYRGAGTAEEMAAEGRKAAGYVSAAKAGTQSAFGGGAPAGEERSYQVNAATQVPSVARNQAVSAQVTRQQSMTNRAREAGRRGAMQPMPSGRLTNRDIRNYAAMVGAGAFLASGSSGLGKSLGSGLQQGASYAMMSQVVQQQQTQQYQQLASAMRAEAGTTRAEVAALRAHMLASGYSKEQVSSILANATAVPNPAPQPKQQAQSAQRRNGQRAEVYRQNGSRMERQEPMREKPRSRFEILREAKEKERAARYGGRNAGGKSLHRSMDGDGSGNGYSEI